MSRLKLLLAFVFFLFLIPSGAGANVCSLNTNLTFVARDPGGSYVAAAKVDVYRQETDSNGRPKPGARVGGGTTDAVLGRAAISWRNSNAQSAPYAIRVQTIGKDNASFWFYHNQMDCGQTLTLEKTLSGLLINFRDAGGDFLTNTAFSVYSQRRDESGAYLQDREELLISGNSGSSARSKIHLPQGSVRSLDGSGPDFYVLEVSRNNQKAYFYNLAVRDGQLTKVNYYLSILRLRLRTADDRAAAGVKVEVYPQEVTLNNEYKRGPKIGEFTIAETGYGSIELAPGTYALGVKGSDNKYQYFWDINVADGQTSQHTLMLGAATGAVCAENSRLNVSFRNFAGVSLAGLKLEVYEQSSGASGFPAAGAKVGSATADANGRAAVSFRPDSQKSYALKVWDKQAERGEYWFFDALKLACGAERNVVKTLGALNIVLRDSAGNLKRDHSFALYAQTFDADNNPVAADNGLIANLKTDAGGQATVYVSPYNLYRPGQTGLYAIRTKDGNNNTANFFGIYPNAERDYTFQAALSGLGGVLVDGRGQGRGNQDIILYQQISEGSGRRLGSQLAKTKTEASGNFRLEYPAGVYALAVKDDFNQEQIFWNVSTQAGSNSQRLVMNTTTFSLNDLGGEGLPAQPSIKIYALEGSAAQGYYRGGQIGSLSLGAGRTASRSLAAGSYLAAYAGKNNREFGVAFNATAGVSQNVSLATSESQIISGQQIFRLGTATPPANNAGGSGFPDLRGRILLQVEDKGQAWYVNPVDGKRYFLGRPADAFQMMQRFGLGISNADFFKLKEAPAAWTRLAGRILIMTENRGQAYYFDPVALELHYLGRPADAFEVMRKLGLGITDANLNRLTAGK